MGRWTLLVLALAVFYAASATKLHRNIILDDHYADRPTFLSADVLKLLPHSTLKHTDSTGKIEAIPVRHLGSGDEQLHDVLEGTSHLPTSARRPDQDFRYRQILAETQSAVRYGGPTPIRPDEEEQTEPASDAERVMQERQREIDALEQRNSQGQPSMYQTMADAEPYPQQAPSPYDAAPQYPSMRFANSQEPPATQFGSVAPPAMQVSSEPSLEDGFDVDEETTPAQMALDQQRAFAQAQNAQTRAQARPPRFSERNYGYGQRVPEDALREMPEQNGPYSPSQYFPPSRSRAFRISQPTMPTSRFASRREAVPLPPSVMQARLERARLRRAEDGRDSLPSNSDRGMSEQEYPAPQYDEGVQNMQSMQSMPQEQNYPAGSYSEGGPSFLEKTESSSPVAAPVMRRRHRASPSVSERLRARHSRDNSEMPGDFSLAETSASASQIPGADEDMAMGDNIDAVEAASDEFMPSTPAAGHVMSARDAGVPAPPPMDPSPAQLERARSVRAVEPIEHYEPPRPPQLA